jgi:valyl-tRNA synthetase
LGWPDTGNSVKGKIGPENDFANYHPTTVLETGYDIIFFWVARMILMSTYTVGQVPFQHVYLHGLVRDAQGRKISKSLGNNIDPVDMVEKYGADAVRMALVIGTGPGNDSKISEDKLKAYKHFANKIWNITRFVLSNTDNSPLQKQEVPLTDTDQTLLAEFKTLITDIKQDMDTYRFYLAGEKLYGYIWHRFADVIIEESKAKLNNSDPAVAISTKYTLRYILENSLVLLHPFMPFITEKIWSNIPHDENKLLMVTEWPQ